MQTLLTSRKFWALVLALVVVIVSAFSPGFELKTDDAAGFAVIVVSYLVGVAVDPGPGGWRGVLQSRKFWAAIVGIALVFMDAFHVVLPLDLAPEQLVTLCVVIGGYITSVAVEKPLLLPTVGG